MAGEKILRFEDLFVHQLRLLYDTEQQLIQSLPRMAARASDPDLKTDLKNHVQETIKQRDRLEKVSLIMNVDLRGTACIGMEGLIKEGEEIFSMQIERDVSDAALIANAQKVEHYEISAYGTACTYAKLLGEQEVLSILKETLSEEKHADELLNKHAKDHIKKKANNLSEPSNFYGRHG